MGLLGGAIVTQQVKHQPAPRLSGSYFILSEPFSDLNGLFRRICLTGPLPP